MTNSMDKGNTHGQMEVFMKENGRIIKWMALANLHGQMEEYTKVLLSRIRSKDMENSNGLIKGNGKDIGMRISKMEKALILVLWGKKEPEYGRMVRNIVGRIRIE